MKSRLLIGASALGLVTVPAPAAGQHMNMPGMQMPAPKPASKPKSAGKKAANKPVQSKKAAKAKLGPDKPAASRSAEDAMPMDRDAMPMPMSAQPSSSAPQSMQAMPMDGNGDHAMAMTGALGPYPVERESSGTAWQPDFSEHAGVMTMSGGWTLMAHGFVDLVYDHQSGRRGDDKLFGSGMLMGMARHPIGNGSVQLRAALSPDPLMGKRGYPLLLASGETANGRDRLIDRQHPHDLFMELSASISQNIGRKSSLFLYAGLPGEPAFGPPAFMHREAILNSPEAPISHHWLDSTHISFGVLTGGFVLDRFKFEVSRFNGREPDQHRWDIETGALDSTAVRLSWNPTRTLSLQGSWGRFVHPEQLEPGVDQTRWAASALWADQIAPGWKMAGTLAWGRKSAHGHDDDDAIAAEASVKHAAWTVFGRGEMTENRELTDVEDGPARRVGKVSLGTIRDFRIAEHLMFGAGGLLSVNFVPEALAPLYGGRSPTGAMAFVRLKLD